jgi:hypothetical protein
VLFTGKGSETVASEAISAGVTDYLQKGTGTDQFVILANRIENAVESIGPSGNSRHTTASCAGTNGWSTPCGRGLCLRCRGSLRSRQRVPRGVVRQDAGGGARRAESVTPVDPRGRSRGAPQRPGPSPGPAPTSGRRAEQRARPTRPPVPSRIPSACAKRGRVQTRSRRSSRAS